MLFRSEAEFVVNAGDCDREGQLLIDEILEYCKYKGPVQRILISDTNPDAVRKALTELKPNEDFRGDRDAARARSQADWLHGMNMTRLYTKLAKKNGYDGGPLRIGRIKTPVTALVVRRDLEIESFVPKPYWTLQAQIQVKEGAFWMAVMVFTTFSSAWAQQKKGAVRWEFVRRMAPGLVAGSLLGSLVSNRIPTSH